MTTSKDRLKRFLARLDGIFGREPKFYPFDSLIPGAPKVAVMVYDDVPEPGYITGVTYGLSEVQHPEWRLGRPELIISVESTDTRWPLAVGELANQLRGDCPFAYGDVINFGEPISPESEMAAFFVFAPSILEREDFLNIDVGGPQTLSLAGMYPIYPPEVKVIRAEGLKAFWHHENFDPFSVTRPGITKL
ncbi:suppressor of fused domain protein [Pelagibius sp. 7325]|uniref:suppressor of fused domain protein n=1 Tax=Pelagibius sp. 7325 TaxID=3131994 RepID=UPI0030ED7FB5